MNLSVKHEAMFKDRIVSVISVVAASVRASPFYKLIYQELSLALSKHKSTSKLQIL
jgi:hypothetical protein